MKNTALYKSVVTFILFAEAFFFHHASSMIQTHNHLDLTPVIKFSKKYHLDPEEAKILMQQYKQTKLLTTIIEQLITVAEDKDQNVENRAASILVLLTASKINTMRIKNTHSFRINQKIKQYLNPDSIDALITTLENCRSNLEHQNNYLSRQQINNLDIVRGAILATMKEIDNTIEVGCDDCNWRQTKKRRTCYCAADDLEETNLNKNMLKTIHLWLHDYLGINGTCYVSDKCENAYMAVANASYPYAFHFNLDISKRAVQDFQDNRSFWSFIHGLLHEASHVITNDLCETLAPQRPYMQGQLREFRAEMWIPTYKNSSLTVAQIRFYTMILSSYNYLLRHQNDYINLTEQHCPPYPSVLEKYVNSRTVYSQARFENTESIKLDLQNIHPDLYEADKALMNLYEKNKDKMLLAPKLIENIEMAKEQNIIQEHVPKQ